MNVASADCGLNGRSPAVSRRCLAALTLGACTGLGGDDAADGELVWAIGGTGADPGGYHQQVVELWSDQDPDMPVRIDRLPESADDAVFMRNWPDAYELLSDPEESEVADEFAIAPLPTFTGEGTVSTLGGYDNAVSAYGRNVDAAKEFVLWAATDEQAQRLLAETGAPPVLASTYDELSDDVQIAALGDILPDARPRPPAPNWNDISVEVEFQQGIFPAYNGDRDAQDVVFSLREYLEATVGG